MTNQDKIAVLQAAEARKDLESRALEYGTWARRTHAEYSQGNGITFQLDWRIAPEPPPRTLFVVLDKHYQIVDHAYNEEWCKLAMHRYDPKHFRIATFTEVPRQPTNAEASLPTAHAQDEATRLCVHAAPEPPQLPKAREWWLNVYSRNSTYAHATKELADTAQVACKAPESPVHVREVLPNEGWISFKDHPPVAGQHILALAPSGSPCIWDYVYQPDHGIHATHWQPMIPLPK